MSQSAPGENTVSTAVVGAARLARGVNATWWYTAVTVLFLELVLIFVVTTILSQAEIGVTAVATVAIVGLVWWASTIALLFDYRHRADAPPEVRWPRRLRLLLPLLIALAFGVVQGAFTGSWLFALFPLAQTLTLLNWQRGVRMRVILGVTLVLAAMSIIDAQTTFADDGQLPGASHWWLSALPIMTVSSLWWWDVLLTLDRARASEARLAATQERLRVATDVHDLQGHHLQVIALQLELAERLFSRDPAGALEQLHAARRSVDEARQGTRDLALQFRSVPLRDELANAADLLHAAGLDVETSVDTNADYAPASDLGPVIRETTTNVLRHGSGKHARLVLARNGESWRYEITNDRVAGIEAAHDGAGLDGIARRIREAGGTVEVRRGDEEFTVVVTVPARWEGTR